MTRKVGDTEINNIMLHALQQGKRRVEELVSLASDITFYVPLTMIVIDLKNSIYSHQQIVVRKLQRTILGVEFPKVGSCEGVSHCMELECVGMNQVLRDVV